jgi:AraC-like DNA-binding protein
MAAHVPLSSKLDLIGRDGYALSASRQPRYAFHWHTHDCAMLLWPRKGGLDTAWESDGARRRGRLVRGQALLLRAHIAHTTRSDCATQQHGELYLSPDLLRGCGAADGLQLDGAAQAMLDALWMPALSPTAQPGLVRTLIEQLSASRPLLALQEHMLGPGRRWLVLLSAAIEDDRALPSVAESAERLGISIRTLQRACLDEFGCSPVTLRRALLARAARSRLATGKSLARVSNELGFANSGHLGRLLKAIP